jgi:small-conductance mechanosensitive channel
MTLPLPLMLVLLFAVAFVQNMAFTAVSRSRNSADVQYHRRCAWASNGVWFVTQILLYNTLWSALTKGTWWVVALTGLVYVISTTEGSCLMMARMLKKETGKRQVGARAEGERVAREQADQIEELLERAKER